MGIPKLVTNFKNFITSALLLWKFTWPGNSPEILTFVNNDTYY